MFIGITDGVSIQSDDMVYVLHYYDRDYYFKTFDLLLLKLINLDLRSKNLNSIPAMLKEITELKALVLSLFNSYGKIINDQTARNIGLNERFANTYDKKTDDEVKLWT